ncbi:class I SAM-dependent methyltransferase [Sulfuriferula sp.]|uniref:class I SAM-dependent methyltransferase n=1 Tax=Sulfuriferula sp. TaxID=2025307 RepID=UPI00273043FE|nr:methyltransferase domain-containing protein [Sulfuriferula sp.]MDP2027403.1 methyltransferase domain-containing protein [Sulfuriferula sp.]
MPTQPTLEPKSTTKGSDAYRDPSWWYDLRGFFILMGSYQVMIWTHLNFFAKNLGQRHLEAAIGSGTFMGLTLLTQRIKGGKLPEEVVGIDYAERMLAGAKKLFRGSKRVKLVQADLSQIEYPDAYFDSVNIAHSFHAFPNPEKVLIELHRVMKPQAKLYVDVLVHPRGNVLKKNLANWINRYALRKGILARLCEVDETKAQFEACKFDVMEGYIVGNTYHLIAQKSHS